MPAQDIAKLAANGVIGVALVLFVLFGGMPWLAAVAVMACVFVPSSAPVIMTMLRSSSSSEKDGAS